jgi:hypothetical protein
MADRKTISVVVNGYGVIGRRVAAAVFSAVHLPGSHWPAHRRLVAWFGWASPVARAPHGAQDGQTGGIGVSMVVGRHP